MAVTWRKPGAKRTAVLYGMAATWGLLSYGCAFLGIYATPSDDEIRFAASSMRSVPRQEALRELRRAFTGIDHAGKRIFDDCRIKTFGEWAFEVDCTSYRSDPNSKEFRLIVEDQFPMTVGYCEPTFNSVRQVPTMAHYFFVNGFSFGGDASRALRAYAVLSRLCLEDATTRQ